MPPRTTDTASHEELLTTDGVLIPPGGKLTVVTRVRAAFRADRAEPVAGIEYESFDLRFPFVAAMHQWGSTAARPAVDVLRCLRTSRDKLGFGPELSPVAFDTAMPDVDISFLVENKGDRPLPFAMRLVGVGPAPTFLREPVEDLCDRDLRARRAYFQAKIDGPENDDRVMADGSAALSYWMSEVSDATMFLEEDKYVSSDAAVRAVASTLTGTEVRERAETIVLVTLGDSLGALPVRVPRGEALRALLGCHVYDAVERDRILDRACDEVAGFAHERI